MLEKVSFNHQKERCLTLSKSLETGQTLLLKILLFVSFQMIEVQAHQIKIITERLDFEVPAKVPN